MPGYALAANVCTAFAGTVHGSCEKANAEGASACQKCKDTQNRELEDDPASTTTPKA